MSLNIHFKTTLALHKREKRESKRKKKQENAELLILYLKTKGWKTGSEKHTNVNGIIS